MREVVLSVFSVLPVQLYLLYFLLLRGWRECSPFWLYFCLYSLISNVINELCQKGTESTESTTRSIMYYQRKGSRKNAIFLLRLDMYPKRKAWAISEDKSVTIELHGYETY